MAAHTTVITQTPNHTISVRDGTLTIDGKGNALNPDEIEHLLEVLLIWKYGLEEISSDDLED